MNGTKPRFRHGIGNAGMLLAALCLPLSPAFAQSSTKQQGVDTSGYHGTIAGGFDKVHALPPGGPTPRMPDGHPDLSGRWYPNSAGRMLQGAYPVDPASFVQFDPKETPEEPPYFKPGMEAKYKRPVPYGNCDQAGTPSTTLEQLAQHAPLELYQTAAGKLVMLDEYPLDVRIIRTDGRPHPKDPDPTFNGDSVAHWEGDTLVIDVIAIDDRLANGVGAGIESGTWFHSPQEHVIERISRPSMNYLVYQVTIEDPSVLSKPWKSAPRRWSLATDPDEPWGEVFCTLNEEPEVWKKITDYQAKEKNK